MTTSAQPGPRASIGFAPRRLPVLGHAWQLLARPLTFLKAQRDKGDIVVFRPGPQQAYLINSPDIVHQMLTVQRHDFVKGGPLYDGLRLLVGDGLATADGELHRKQRKLIQPTFAASRFPDYAAVMTTAATEISESWHDGEILTIDQEMYTLSATVMGRCLYSGRLESEVISEIIHSVPVALEGIGRRAAVPVRWLHALFPRENRRFARALASAHKVTDHIIADYRTNGADHEDVLSTLLAARDENTGEPMSDQQIHDEVLTLIGAATEATAVTISWALHTLATRPDIESTVRTELRDVLGDRPVTHTDLPHLPYLTAVVSETLRVHAPLWLVPRRATTDTTLGGHPIPAASYVFFSPYANHHDPALFTDPDTFDPGRWLAGQPKPPRCAHIPFGAGFRKCLGDTFATTEAIIALATITRHWQLRPHSDHPLRPRVFSTLGTGPLVMTATSRTSTSGTTG